MTFEIEIKNRFTGSVIFAAEAVNLQACIKSAIADGVSLRYCNLSGCDLSGCDLGDGIKITKAPILISGLFWSVVIWDNHMQIGYEFRSHEAWHEFSEDDWLRMGKEEALHLKHWQLSALLLLCDGHRPRTEK